MSSKVLALVATIPARLRSCQRLLDEIARQSRPPDGVILVLDGYGSAPGPCSPSGLVAQEHRTDSLSGPGARWRVAKELSPDNILINLDDDVMLMRAPHLVQALCTAVEQGQGAAAAMGRTLDGKPAPPGRFGRGRLFYGAGCGLAVRAGHLDGLQDLADQVRMKGGFDALGVHGDDDALVSALLWMKGIQITHAATGNIFPAPNTRSSSQTQALLDKRKPMDSQKKAIAAITGWPWPRAS